MGTDLMLVRSQRACGCCIHIRSEARARPLQIILVYRNMLGSLKRWMGIIKCDKDISSMRREGLSEPPSGHHTAVADLFLDSTGCDWKTCSWRKRALEFLLLLLFRLQPPYMGKSYLIRLRIWREPIMVMSVNHFNNRSQIMHCSY